MGLQPGESDCSLCLLRPREQGGNGACPVRGAVKEMYEKRAYPCPKFREGDYAPKGERQEEALF